MSCNTNSINSNNAKGRASGKKNVQNSPSILVTSKGKTSMMLPASNLLLTNFITNFTPPPTTSSSSPTLSINASLGVSASNSSQILQSITFSNSNSISFGLSNGVITASYNNAGGGVALSAGTQTAQTGTVVFSNSNGVTFGMNASTITASVGGVAAGSISAGTTKVALGQAVFSNSHGISFGVNGSTITASHNGLTSQSNQALSGSNGSFGFQTASFGNLNGLSFYTSNGSMVGSYTVPTGTAYVFSNSNNVSFGTAGSTITATASFSQTVQTQSNVQGISAGTQVGRTGDIVFSNSNGISFGMSNSSVITASYTVPIITNSSLTISAGTVSETASEVVFSNSNGVSFGLTGGTVTATVKTDYQSSGNYLITAMLSDAGSRFVNTSAALNLTNISATFNSNSISLSVAAGAIQSVQPVAASASNGSFLFSTLKFVETDGVTWATSTDGIRASVQTNYQSTGNYLTTAALSTQTLAFTLSGNSATTNSSQISNGGYALAGGNGVTLQQSNNTISISVATNYQSQGAYLTTAMASNRGSDFVQATAAFAGTNASGTIASGGISVSVAAQSAQIGISSVALSNTTYTSGQISFRDGNGISWASTTGQGISITHGLQFTSATSAITSNALNTSVARIQAIAASDATYTSGSVTFRDLNGITWQSTTGQQIQITHGLQYTSATSAITSNALNTSASRVINILAATNSTGGGTASLSSNVSFSNVNNFTFYTSAGNAIVASFSQSIDTGKAGTGFTSAGNNIGLSGTLNTNGLSLSATVAAQTNQTLGIFASSNTTLTSTGTIDARSFSIRGIGAASVGFSASELIISVPVAGGAQTAISGIVASNTTYTSGSVTFRDGNGISWASTTGQQISITHALQYTSQMSDYQSTGAYLTTAAQSTQTFLASLGGNTGTTNSSRIGNGGFVFAGGNGVTINQSNNSVSWSVETAYQSQGAYLTTAAQSTQTLMISLGGNSATTNSSRISNGGYILAGGNGVTIQQSNNTVSLSVATNYQSQGAYLTTAALSTQTLAFTLSGNIATTNSSQILNSGYALAGGNGVTLQQSNNTVSISVATNYQSQGAYLTTARGSTDAIGLNTAQTNVTWTVNSSGLSLNAGGYAGTGFTSAGANISLSGTLNTAGLSLSASVAAPGAAAEANNNNLLGANTAGNTTASGSTIGLSGINITLSGTNASQIVISAAAQTNQNLSLYALGNTTQNSSTLLNASVMSFNGLGAMTWGYSNGSIQASAPATSSISGTGQVSVSVNGSTISIGVPNPYVSSYQNSPVLANSSVMTWNGASVSHAAAFDIPSQLSFAFLRIPVQFTSASTTLATMASATASAQGGLFSTVNAVVYSLGTGVNSKSLQSVTSGSTGYSFTQKISVTNSTQGSYSLGYTGWAETALTSLSTQYSVSNTNYSFTTNAFSAFSGSRMLDIPMSGSLTAGPYWIIIGMSTSSSTAGAAGLTALTNCNIRYSGHIGMSQVGGSFGVMGSTNTDSGGLMGVGSFSSAGGATTNSVNISAITAMASNAMLFFQLLRSA